MLVLNRIKQLSSVTFAKFERNYHNFNPRLKPNSLSAVLYKSFVSQRFHPNTCWKCGLERKSVAGLFCDQCKVLQTPLETKNFFRIFNLDEKFDIDAKELRMQYRRLQAQLHPDKFTQKTAEEKEISESFSSLVNKAYNNLQFPLKRAEHLLELRGDQLNEKENAVDDPEFLMEMMELNEELENTTNVEKLKALNIKNRTQLEIITKNIDECFKENDLKQAKYFVIKMKYYTSLGNRINAILRELGIVD
ncbi:iron-sulfur cluster co-chaperone protein HscB [Dendroctonus ponderosae]|uniref:iron-sulfur cluster co-chaperone protein HscB n=1 Tax=Dendroctonus ponderosae TaxID=77166 RepID=UPI0020354B58|nr:iron-sulfur cluster co-chaperone protein HscB [Dendroctonus ponderosae]